MKTFIKISIVLISIFLLHGCIEVDTTLNVNKDGSGTLEEKVLMSSEMVQMMKQFSQSFSSDSTQNKGFEVYNEEDVKSKAQTFGKGVKFVSGKEVKEGDREGYKAIYSFENLNDLQYDMNPSNEVPMGASESSDNGNTDYSFKFIPGSPAQVQIIAPENKEETKADEETNTEDDTTNTGMGNMDLVTKFLKDLRISMKVHVNGTIKNTNANFVDGQDVTLFKMDFNELLKNPEKLKQFKNKKPNSLEEMNDLMKNLKGFQIETNKKVNISFD